MLLTPIVPSADTFVFTQVMPSSVWSIRHNLGKYPSVTVVDTALTVHTGLVQYTDTVSLTVTFGAAFSGQAFCN